MVSMKVSCDTVGGYDVKLRHFTWHSRKQLQGARPMQNSQQKESRLDTNSVKIFP